ncbi:MAG: HAD family hydrolase [Candidatus Anstonellales archaeon]
MPFAIRKSHISTSEQLKILKEILGNKAYILIFDMDGTLTEKTEPKCIKLILKAIKGLYGMDIYKKARKVMSENEEKLLGKPDFEMIKSMSIYLKNVKNSVKIDYKEVSKLYRALLKANLHKIYNERALMPYASAFIKKAKNDFCIVSSALAMQIEKINKVLLRKTGKKARFIVSYEMTKRHKPFPDPYLKAKEKLKRLGYKAGVVFEDSNNGVKAAKKAGFKVIKIGKKKGKYNLTWKQILSYNFLDS